jgi:hypothetical protein
MFLYGRIVHPKILKNANNLKGNKVSLELIELSSINKVSLIS